MFNYDDEPTIDNEKPIKRRDFNKNPQMIKTYKIKKRFNRNSKYPNYLEKLLEEEGYDSYSDDEDF